METNYVRHSPISPHANFFVNRLVVTVILVVNIVDGGKGTRSHDSSELAKYLKKLFKMINDVLQ